MIKKFFAFISGITLMISGCEIMFDPEGYTLRKTESRNKKLRENSIKLENKIIEEEKKNIEEKEFIKSIQNLIQDVKFSDRFCDGKKYQLSHWLVLCFDREKNDIPFNKIQIVVYLHTPHSRGGYPAEFQHSSSAYDCDDENLTCDYIIIKHPGENYNSARLNEIRQAHTFEDVSKGKIDKVEIKLQDKNNWKKVFLTKVFEDF